MCKTPPTYLTECITCGRAIALPFPARTPKRCEDCAGPPSFAPRGWPGPGPDEDANGGWANVVAALEEDR